MAEMTTSDYIELGMLYIREERYRAAYNPLRQALLVYGEHNVQDAPTVLLSYYGLCLVALEKEVDRGLEFCRQAIDQAGHRTDFYLNLGKAYIFLNRKSQAIAAFEHGLEIDHDTRLQAELWRLGVRRRPLLAFLARRNLLNRYLGLWRARRHS